MWSLRNRSSDSRVRVGLRKRRPKARFKSTYRVKTGASMEENAAVALVIAAPPLPRVLFLGPEGGLRVSPRLPVADTLTSSVIVPRQAPQRICDWQPRTYAKSPFRSQEKHTRQRRGGNDQSNRCVFFHAGTRLDAVRGFEAGLGPTFPQPNSHPRIAGPIPQRPHHQLPRPECCCISSLVPDPGASHIWRAT